MEIEKIIVLLKNAGINVHGADNVFIYFEDPSCIYTAFDNILHYAWIVILVLTGIMLFGWALLYIKNGVKINDLFNNAKTIILIFCVLSLVKPIVNFVYGDNLFGRNCDIIKVPLVNVQELLNIRNKTLSNVDENSLYEVFDMVDSGVVGQPDSVSVDDTDEEYDEEIDDIENE